MHTEYTSINLNTTGTTAVHSPTTDAVVERVAMENGGGTAVARLEVTDGTSTAVLTPGQAAGDGISVGSVALNQGDTLQVNVTTAEGAAQTNTCVVSRNDD